MSLFIQIQAVLLVASSGLVFADSVSPPPIGVNSGSQLTQLTLRDCYGKPHALADDINDRTVAFVFLGTECPLARLYAPRIEKLYQQRKEDPSVTVIGVISNVQDSLTDVTAYAARHELTFPLLMDPDQKLAEILGATRTPEAVVVNPDGAITYRGRIDDQYGISIQRTQPTRADLDLAISQTVAATPVDVPLTKAMGCLIGRRTKTAPTDLSVTYTRDVAPIFHNHCAECHREGQIAPFPLTSFEETVGWGPMIAEVVQEERMPPWNADPAHGKFGNDARLTSAEKSTILRWIENGSPEGDAADLPSLPKFTSQWRMPEPDQVISITEKPVAIPATGVVDYKYYVVDPKFTEDRWVMAAEARPGNTAVVHHIIAFIRTPGDDRVSLGRMLIGYAPGTQPLVFDEQTAMRVPAGSELLFEVHYTPNGSPQTDQSSIAIRFADADKVRREVIGREAINTKFRIPPKDGAYAVGSRPVEFDEPTRIVSLTPHMHLRGRSFRYELELPDGSRETLLNVPRYDFNWQLRYELAEPRLVPAGSRIHCYATFDNSSENPNNPDPTQWITWGQQSWEEMMIGFVTTVRDRPSKSENASGAE